MLGNEFFDLVKRASSRKRVANHPNDQGSEVNLSVAGNAFVDEIEESEAETHCRDGWDMIDSEDFGFIEDLLSWCSWAIHGRDPLTKYRLLDLEVSRCFAKL